MNRDASSERRELVIGTRGSALALAQTNIVCDALRELHPSLELRVERITTTGDMRTDVPLSQLGRGVFVSEIEEALGEGRIDVGVHSAKDLPSVLDERFAFAAFPRRADARDVLVSRGEQLHELPAGARVGTSSPRRACLLRAARPDLDLRNVRGNVDTRLRKLAAGDFDALVLAAAGMIRLGREAEATEWLDPEVMIPCVGQGALALEIRAGDERTKRLLCDLDDAPTRCCVTAERSFLAELGAGCRAAAAAYARIDVGGRLMISAFIGDVDGRYVRASRSGNQEGGEELGRAIAHELLRAGGAGFLALNDSALAGKRVAVTRSADQAPELMALLRARGAIPVACPTISVHPVENTSQLDAALAELSKFHWLAFTSVNAVDAVADRVDAMGIRVPVALRLAAVGTATADRVARRIRPVDFISPESNSDSLATHLPVSEECELLFPRSDLAPDTFAVGMRKRGVRVHDVVVYHTVPGPGAAALASGIQSGEFDAVVFTSPSTLRFASGAVDALRLRTGGPRIIICIGSTTGRAARELGLVPNGVAATQSVGGIVETLERCFATERRAPALTTH